MLSIQSLSYHYPKNKREVLSDVNLNIGKGAIYGLLGANGTGKSTLLYCICGLLRAQKGQVLFNGENTSLRLPSTLSDIFIVPEEIELPPVNMEGFVAQTAPFYPSFSAEDLKRYLLHFHLPENLHLGALSMGQKKKAYIAFALACNTSLLLMDEPTNGLDIPGKAEFRRAIVEGAPEGRTVIISTHQVRDLDQVLDHVVILSQKGIVLDASLRKLQDQFQFLFTSSPTEVEDALWVQPTLGGYNAVRRRTPSDPETEVNLESLFECIFSNPQIFSVL